MDNNVDFVLDLSLFSSGKVTVVFINERVYATLAARIRICVKYAHLTYNSGCRWMFEIRDVERTVSTWRMKTLWTRRARKWNPHLPICLHRFPETLMSRKRQYLSLRMKRAMMSRKERRMSKPTTSFENRNHRKNKRWRASVFSNSTMHRRLRQLVSSDIYFCYQWSSNLSLFGY